MAPQDDRFDDEGPAGPVRIVDFDALDDADDAPAPEVRTVDLGGLPGEPDEPDEDGPRSRVASFDGLDGPDVADVPDVARVPDGPGGAAATTSEPRAGATRQARFDAPPRSRAAIVDDPQADGVDAARGRARSRGGRAAGRNGRAPGGRTDGRADRRAAADPPADDETRAKEICLRLLGDRARTVKELRDALIRKEIPGDVADRVLERFDEVGLVDDEAFAGQWVRSRHNHRGLGKRAIALELHRKGVAREIADEALTEIDAESEEAKARELVGKKIRTVKVGTREERAVASRRLVGMLARKGYGAGVAYTVVREAIAARGAEEDELGEEPAHD